MYLAGGQASANRRPAIGERLPRLVEGVEVIPLTENDSDAFLLKTQPVWLRERD
jgi:hypothetical protein